MPIMSDAQIEQGIAGYAERDREDLRWMVAFARTELDGSREALGEKLDSDWTTISRILRGAYNAPIDGFLRKVRAMRRDVESSNVADFTTTVVTEKIHSVLDYALAGDVDGGKIVAIIAPSGRGKTKSVKRWIHRNRGRAVYVDCPATGGQGALLREIADATGLSPNMNTTKLAGALMKSFTRERALILDEVSRIVPVEAASKPRAMEFIRRLHDVKRCPVVMIITPQTWMEIENGAMRLYFEQLIGRIDFILNIPDSVRADELRAICTDAAGGRPDAKLIEEARASANEKGRLRRLFSDLKKAGKIAAGKGEKLNGEHLRIARLHRKQLGVWPADEVAA